jgi:hypothetical protein
MAGPPVSGGPSFFQKSNDKQPVTFPPPFYTEMEMKEINFLPEK